MLVHRRFPAFAAVALLCASLVPTASVAACGMTAAERGAGASHGMTGAMYGLRVVTQARARRDMAADDAGCRKESASVGMRDAAGRVALGTRLSKSGEGRAEIHQDLTVSAYRSSRMQLNVMGRNTLRSARDRTTTVAVKPTFTVMGLEVASSVEQKWRSTTRAATTRAGLTVGRQIQFRASARRERGSYYREVGASARTARPVGPLAELSGSARWEMDRRRYTLGVGAKIGKRARINLSHSGAVDKLRDGALGLGVEATGKHFSVGARSRFSGTRVTSTEVRAKYRF